MPSVDVVEEPIRERVGSDLRAIIAYDGREYDCTLRDDLAEQYSESEIRRIVNRSIVIQLGVRDHPSSLKTGDLDALVRTYEDAWLVGCPAPNRRKSGVLVSVARNGGDATFADVDECVRVLEDAVDEAIA
ncbi:hypothetical protein ACFQDG_13405 [Natronoarchaeum mannanilyticum]|uniref:Uncharacterized protein n=1 Tax=Natronoarchaeum mannanilyticum TaxID=926360 RepID=A0AAV3TAS1_9EURY